MFAQLGTVVFDGLQTFVTLNTSEEIALAEFALIGRKPKLMGGGIALRIMSLSIFLHVEFTPGAVEDEINKLRTSLENFEILPLLWGNGETGGDYIIKQLETEYTNLDAVGNVYEARVNLSLIESVEDNKAVQEQQAASKNAFATGDKRPATKSKRKNVQGCPNKIAQLVQEIQQFGNVINQIVPVYTGDQKQAALVAQGCTSISEDCSQIETAVNTAGSCVYQNISLQQAAHSCNLTAATLSGDIQKNAKAASGIDVGDDVHDGTVINAENNGLQSTIKNLATIAQPIIKTAIVK